MDKKVIKTSLLFLIFVVILWGCTEPWEDHIKLNDGVATNNLMEILNNHSDLSEFTGYLIAAGWEEELASSKSFTVWAPTNEAMNLVDEGNLSDSVSLARFVNNHICFTAYSYYGTPALQKVKTYSGKNILVDNENGKVEDASLIEPYDIVAANGILHKIDKPLTPKPNVWEIIETTGLCPKHTGYLNNLTGMVFDPSMATITGVDPVTGKPVYDTLSGMVWSNQFITEVRDLKNEDSLSTMILIEDAVFDLEFSKYRKYFELNDPVESDNLTNWQICRELVYRGLLELDNIPDTIISLYGIKIPFDKSAVQHIYNASNGIVYVLSNCDVRLQDKIHPIIVEGEDTTKHIFTALTGQTGYTRQKELASGGYDFILDNHGANPGNLKYFFEGLVAARYEFYWVAVNDFDGSYRSPNPDLELQQKLDYIKVLGYLGKEIIWDDPKAISPDLIPVTDSTYETAREVYLGQRVLATYQDLWLQVTGGGNNMAITLDYLKAVPVLE